MSAESRNEGPLEAAVFGSVSLGAIWLKTGGSPEVPTRGRGRQIVDFYLIEHPPQTVIKSLPPDVGAQMFPRVTVHVRNHLNARISFARGKGQAVEIYTLISDCWLIHPGSVLP